MAALRAVAMHASTSRKVFQEGQPPAPTSIPARAKGRAKIVCEKRTRSNQRRMRDEMFKSLSSEATRRVRCRDGPARARGPCRRDPRWSADASRTKARRAGSRPRPPRGRGDCADARDSRGFSRRITTRGRRSLRHTSAARTRRVSETPEAMRPTVPAEQGAITMPR